MFSILFIDQFATNNPKVVHVGNLFDLKQSMGESLKASLRVSLRCLYKSQSNEGMFVDVFIKGLRAKNFAESLVENDLITWWRLGQESSLKSRQKS